MGIPVPNAAGRVLGPLNLILLRLALGKLFGLWRDLTPGVVRRLHSLGRGWVPHIRVPPTLVRTHPDDIIFSERKEAAEQMADNMQQIERRKKRPEKDGGFRVYTGKKKGFKRRADEATRSKEVHRVAGFRGPGVVVDENDKEHLTKLVKSVPLDGSVTAPAEPRERAQVTQALRQCAVALRDLLGTGKTPGAAHRELKASKSNFSAALRERNMSFNRFADMFPDLIIRRGDKLFPANQQTLA